MLTLVVIPPQNDLQRQWAPRLQRSLPAYRAVVLENAWTASLNNYVRLCLMCLRLRRLSFYKTHHQL